MQWNNDLLRYTLAMQGRSSYFRQPYIRIAKYFTPMRDLSFMRFVLFLSMALAVANVDLSAQSKYSNKSSLSLPQIMQGEKFVGYSPTNIEWAENSQAIYFDWNPERGDFRDRYRVNIGGGNPVKVTAAEERALPTAGGSYSKNGKYKVYEDVGDIYWMDLGTGAVRPITQTVDRESSPEFSEDDQKVIYRSGNNLFVWETATGNTRQLSNFKSGAEPREPLLSEQEAWLETDQLEHFEVLRERKRMQELREKRREENGFKYPSEVYLGGKRVWGLKASPDLQYITCQLITSADDNGTMVPDFVTQSGYTKELEARSKVGESQSTYELGIYDVERDTFYLVKTEDIEGIYDKPKFLKDYHKDGEAYLATYEKPREVIIHSPIYSTEGLAVVDVKAQDNKDRWIMLLDLPTGKLKLLDRQHDDAWVGGPGISSWNGSRGDMGWINGHTLWFHSEESGYSHLYTVDIFTDDVEQLTEGEFEVLEAQLSKDKMHFYMVTNEKSPHANHVYKMPVTGGARTQLTTQAGGYQMWLSPDEKYFALRYSSSNKPWELYVMENKEGATPRQLTISTTRDFESYKWRTPDIVRFKASDGAEVPARLYLPDNPNKKTPAVIFVHGAGYLQNVHRWWSSYYREYMFHNMLADNGFVVLDIDYRGSKGYGRDWRTGIYRHMGGKDLSDQVDGAKYLVEGLGINPNRIGIYGGSYGGFITLMAMFNAPETFQCGAALRSVTDWAHYNHPYTSNILNTPAEDSIAYRRSSPIYFADGLKGRLVMLHGMVDTNVQFQDVVRLSQRLIELGKTNWDLAVFPMEGHGFVEPSSWADEYRRIYEMFMDELME